jgi:RNA polymerase II elongation factor ELL
LVSSSYPDIRTTDERTRYKAEFNADYAEYRELHAVVERVSRRFAELDVLLQQEAKDSPGYKVSGGKTRQPGLWQVHAAFCG